MILVSTRHSTVITYLFLFIQLILRYRDIYILFQNLWLQRSGVVWLLEPSDHLRADVQVMWARNFSSSNPVKRRFWCLKVGCCWVFFLGMCLPPVKRVMAPPKKDLCFKRVKTFSPRENSKVVFQVNCKSLNVYNCLFCFVGFLMFLFLNHLSDSQCTGNHQAFQSDGLPVIWTFSVFKMFYMLCFTCTNRWFKVRFLIVHLYQPIIQIVVRWFGYSGRVGALPDAQGFGWT